MAREIEAEYDEEAYEDMLNEIYGEVDVCGFKHGAGTLLKEIDPIAFRCGMSDWHSELDSQWECETCGEVYDTEDEANECCETEEEDE